MSEPIMNFLLSFQFFSNNVIYIRVLASENIEQGGSNLNRKTFQIEVIQNGP